MAVTAEASSGQRIKGTILIKQIEYGIKANCLQKTIRDGSTHGWTAYLKSFNNEDISVFIKEVHFKFDGTYTNYNKVVTEPPYQVKGTGSSEIQVFFEIYFKDPNESSVTIPHDLNFSDVSVSPNPQHCLRFTVSALVEELLFYSPTKIMYRLLTQTDSHCKKFLDDKKYKFLAEKLQCTVLVVLKSMQMLSIVDKELTKCEKVAATLEETVKNLQSLRGH